MLPYFHDLSLTAWLAEAAELGLTRVQALRIFRAVHRASTFPHVPESWTQIDAPPKQLARVAERFALAPLPKVVDKRVSEDYTIKFLLGLADGRNVEAVYIPEGTRGTLCVSSQVGCAMACDFCFTGKMGLHRHLRPHEIVGQYARARQELGNLEITNMVFMGMGEPLHNLDNVLTSLEILTNDYGHGVPPRRISVSTSGLLPAIKVLFEKTTVRLALSVNGPNPEKRLRVMPVEKAYPIEDVLAYLRARSEAVGNHHQAMFEYVLLGGENDSLEDAADLVRMLEGVPGRINLIPFNPHPGSPYLRPTDEAVDAFHAYLRAHDRNVFVRKSRGRDVLAACGQLHQQHERRKESIRAFLNSTH